VVVSRMVAQDAFLKRSRVTVAQRFLKKKSRGRLLKKTFLGLFSTLISRAFWRGGAFVTLSDRRFLLCRNGMGKCRVGKVR
jgi:hypothetical protein